MKWILDFLTDKWSFWPKASFDLHLQCNAILKMLEETSLVNEVKLEDLAKEIDLETDILFEIMGELIEEGKIHGIITGSIFLKLPPAVAQVIREGMSRGIISGSRLSNILEISQMTEIFSFLKEKYQGVEHLGPFLLFHDRIDRVSSYYDLQVVIEKEGGIDLKGLKTELDLTGEEVLELSRLLSERSSRDMTIMDEIIVIKARLVCELCTSIKTDELDVWHECLTCSSKFCPKCYDEKILPGILVDFGECPKCLSPSEDALKELSP